MKKEFIDTPQTMIPPIKRYGFLAQPIVVTDVAGRKVTFAQPVSRERLADVRALMALNILLPQTPLKGIIA